VYDDPAPSAGGCPGRLVDPGGRWRATDAERARRADAWPEPPGAPVRQAAPVFRRGAGGAWAGTRGGARPGGRPRGDQEAAACPIPPRTAPASIRPQRTSCPAGSARLFGIASHSR
jgi:hypothetical protein